jgi:septum formation protein
MPSSTLPRLILASSSAYRRELLGRLHLPFEAIAPDIDETPHPDETPEATALRLAREKAAAVALANPGPS